MERLLLLVELGEGRWMAMLKLWFAVLCCPRLKTKACLGLTIWRCPKVRLTPQIPRISRFPTYFFFRIKSFFLDCAPECGNQEASRGLPLESVWKVYFSQSAEEEPQRTVRGGSWPCPIWKHWAPFPGQPTSSRVVMVTFCQLWSALGARCSRGEASEVSGGCGSQLD